MALCSSCQNIVPQSAARCPVCGNAPGISADEFLESLGSAPDDIVEIDPADTSMRSVTAPNGRTFTPPPLPTSGSTGPGVDPSPRMPVRRGTTTTSSTSATGMVDQTSPIVDGNGVDDGEEIVRTVRAISNRLDADIRIGRRNGHRVVVTAAPLAAAAILVVGTLLSYNFADLGRPTVVTTIENSAPPGTLAFGEERSAEAQRSAETVAAQVHEIVAIDCDVPVTANAIALSPTRLVTSASVVTNDAHPIVRFADNTTRPGTVIGVDRKTDIAVVEFGSTVGFDALQWGVADQIFADPAVVVVERFGPAINGSPAVVDQIDGVVGLVKSFGFSGATFRPGSAVLDNEGFVIGMVDETGRAAIGGAELGAAYGRVIARPSTPATTCPIDETPVAPTVEETTTTD